MLYFYRFSLLLSILGFAACQTSSSQYSYPVSKVTHVVPGGQITEKIMPGVRLASQKAGVLVKPKLIFDEVIRSRTNKRMQLVRKEPYTLTMKIKVARAKIPTEARMVYSLYRYEQGFWLTARAYQVLHPGRGQESLIDVTSQVAKEIQLELNRIAEKGK